MDAILAIADTHGLLVVEDCAHAFGGQWRGAGLGTLGHFGSFSLQSSKLLTAGEGGVLLCRTPELAASAASIANCGRPFAPGGTQGIPGDPQHFGVNYRMTELQAALAAAQVARLPDQQRRRAEAMLALEHGLAKVDGIRLLRTDPRVTRRCCWLYMLAIDPQVFGRSHQEVSAALTAEGIPNWIGYEAMHRYPLFCPLKSRLPVAVVFPERFDYRHLPLPVAERASAIEAIWLHQHVLLDGERGVEDAVRALIKVRDAGATP